MPARKRRAMSVLRAVADIRRVPRGGGAVGRRREKQDRQAQHEHEGKKPCHGVTRLQDRPEAGTGRKHAAGSGASEKRRAARTPPFEHARGVPLLVLLKLLSHEGPGGMPVCEVGIEVCR